MKYIIKYLLYFLENFIYLGIIFVMRNLSMFLWHFNTRKLVSYRTIKKWHEDEIDKEGPVIIIAIIVVLILGLALLDVMSPARGG